MRNRQVLKIVKQIAKKENLLTPKELAKAMETTQTELRSAMKEGNMENAYLAYGKLAYQSFSHLYASGLVTVKEVDDDGEGYLYGASHVDLLLTYVEDFVGGELLYSCVNKYLEKDAVK